LHILGQVFLSVFLLSTNLSCNFGGVLTPRFFSLFFLICSSLFSIFVDSTLYTIQINIYLPPTHPHHLCFLFPSFLNFVCFSLFYFFLAILVHLMEKKDYILKGNFSAGGFRRLAGRQAGGGVKRTDQKGAN